MSLGAMSLGACIAWCTAVQAQGTSVVQAQGTSVAQETSGAYLSPLQQVVASSFWWPSVLVERASSHLKGTRSIDETRFGLSLAYRTRTLSPHVRVLISPSLGAYDNLAAMAAVGFRVHFELAGLPLSYGVGLHVETRLRDSVWLSYATPIELGTPLYRGASAEHFLFVGARRTMGGALINSFLLDPNGYDNENSRDRLLELREEHPWQVYVSLAFGRRVE